MAALNNLTDERAETRRELDITRGIHDRLRQRVAELERAGEPADSSWLRKLGWQIEACVTWIARYQKRLEEAA